MKLRKTGNSESMDVLFRIKRGLAADISYSAAGEVGEAFREYVLYEPFLRIVTARGYTVKYDVEGPGIQDVPIGDRRRLNFVARGHSLQLAIEVRWEIPVKTNLTTVQLCG